MGRLAPPKTGWSPVRKGGRFWGGNRSGRSGPDGHQGGSGRRPPRACGAAARGSSGGAEAGGGRAARNGEGGTLSHGHAITVARVGRPVNSLPLWRVDRGLVITCT